MNMCDCYCEEKYVAGWFRPDTPVLVKKSVCNGTRERDECSCGGDRTKCDFYPEVREKTIENVSIRDAINHFQYGISHDIFSEPVTSYAKLAIKALKKLQKG